MRWVLLVTLVTPLAEAIKDAATAAVAELCTGQDDGHGNTVYFLDYCDGPPTVARVAVVAVLEQLTAHAEEERDVCLRHHPQRCSQAWRLESHVQWARRLADECREGVSE